MPHGTSRPVASTLTWPAAPPVAAAAELGRLPAGAGWAVGWSDEQAASPVALSAASTAAIPRLRTPPDPVARARRRDRSVGTCGVTGRPQAGELVEPAGGMMRITRSSCGVGLPAASLFEVVSHSAPSGAATTVRSRPYAPIR